MKLPSAREVQVCNRSFGRRSDELHRRVLAVALTQYARLSGDKKGLGLLRSRSFPQLLSWADGVAGTVYPSADLQFAAHQTTALIRKYPWDPSVVQTDPEQAAIETFKRSEHRCARVNQWFAIRSRPFPRRRSDRWEYYLDRMRSFIRYVIKDAPDLAAIYESCDFTAGASIGVHGDATNLGRKLSSSSWSMTPSVVPILAAALSHNVHFGSRFARSNGVIQSLHISETDVLAGVQLVRANKIAFVPKTAKTFRSIAVEPLGNGYIQKGTDIVLRKLLKRIGIDLSDQTLNQRMAREGSMTDSDESFCTLDLTSASDSISVALVKELLPPDWFNFLNRIRSPSYELEGKFYTSNKFCTMGNGFCFPLETLIFAAACHAVKAGHASEDFMVYGDDIIVRRKVYDELVLLLSRIGFIPNRRKSFREGPFRESCGAHWYLGEDVNSFTLDFRLDSLQSMFKFVNLARRNSRSSSYLEECIRIVIMRIPDRFLFWRPFKGAADTGLDPCGIKFTPLYWQRSQKLQCHKWVELETRPVKDELRYPSWVVMAAAMRGHSSHAPFTYRRKTVMRVRFVARSGDLTSSGITSEGTTSLTFALKVRLTAGLLPILTE